MATGCPALRHHVPAGDASLLDQLRLMLAISLNGRFGGGDLRHKRVVIVDGGVQRRLKVR